MTERAMANLLRCGYDSPLAPLGAVELVTLWLRDTEPDPPMPIALWIVGGWRMDEAGECLSALPQQTESTFRWMLSEGGSPESGCIEPRVRAVASPSPP